MAKRNGIISSDEAKALDQNFDERHQLISDSILKRPDNRSAWWSLQDIRDYLDHAENQSKELGYTMDGIRVYLGAYPNVDGKVGYSTMFMVPTGVRNDSTDGSVNTNNRNEDGGSGDVKGGDGLNKGSLGHPPNNNYPQ